MENECEALPGVAYPGVRDNRSTINTKTGYDDDDDDDGWADVGCCRYDHFDTCMRKVLSQLRSSNATIARQVSSIIQCSLTLSFYGHTTHHMLLSSTLQYVNGNSPRRYDTTVCI